MYLLPGLTWRQRKAVIRRLRQEASRGFGPALPVPGLVIALALDRIRVAAATLAAVVRLHPTVTLLPGAAIAAMTLFVLASTGGAGPGSVSRSGLDDGVLVSNGQSALAARPELGGGLGGALSGPSMFGTGGSGLGSAVPAPVWSRPASRRAHHDGRHRHHHHQHRPVRPVQRES